MAKNKFYPCLWFNTEGKEAAELYCRIFGNSRITADNGMVVNFELSGQKFMCLNGGPHFKINPSISIYTVLESENEVESVWNELLKNGKVLMPLDRYDWSPKYGWIEDRFGVNWQISYGKLEDVGQKFTPSLLFTGEKNGKAEEAVHYYTSLVKNSSVKGILKYSATDADKEGNVKHSQFSLNDYVFMAMDSSLAHNFSFNEGFSIVLECKDQSEIDYYWNHLTSQGGQESRCGWLKDRFGVSWQIIPADLGQWMTDPSKAQRVMKELMKMNKLEVDVLKNA